MEKTQKRDTVVLVVAFLALAVSLLTSFNRFAGAQFAAPLTGSPSTQTSVIVSHATSTQILAANSARRYALICDLDANNIHFAFNTQATTSSTYLAASGGCYEILGDSNLITTKLTGISTGAASSVVSVVEY